jgi:hypothetical protein
MTIPIFPRGRTSHPLTDFLGDNIITFLAEEGVMENILTYHIADVLGQHTQNINNSILTCVFHYAMTYIGVSLILQEVGGNIERRNTEFLGATRCDVLTRSPLGRWVLTSGDTETTTGESDLERPRVKPAVGFLVGDETTHRASDIALPDNLVGSGSPEIGHR